MNQQAFYRDTAIGEFELDAKGMLAYRTWNCRGRTVQAKQHAYNLQSTKRLKFKLAEMWERK